MPTYNSSGTLKRALDSVYAQSSLPREIIVVDDGSDDWEQCERIVASCPNSIASRFIRMDKNQGPSAARNIGISTAVGRYLAFLDSDDIWYREKLAVQYGLMVSRNLDFSMHRYCHDVTRAGCNGDDRHRNDDHCNHSHGNDSHGNDSLPNDNQGLSPSAVSPLSSWTPLLRNDSTNSVMVLRQKMVLYDTSLRRGEDFTLYMELLREKSCKALYIKRSLAGGFKSTLGVSGLSQDVTGMHLGRMLALKKLINTGTISRVQYLFGIATEMLKYPVRILRLSLFTRARLTPARPSPPDMRGA